jgi:hypothetical protein
MDKFSVENFKPLHGRMCATLKPKTALWDSPTLVYEFVIPLEPFQLALEAHLPAHYFQYRSFDFGFVRIPVRDWRELDGREFTIAKDDADISFYAAGFCNPVDLLSIRFQRLSEVKFKLECLLLCDFEYTSLAENILVPLITTVDFEGLNVERKLFPVDRISDDVLIRAIEPYVALDAYRLEPVWGESAVPIVSLPPHS